MNRFASYILSAYSIICTHSTEELLDVGNQIRNGSPIPSFDEKLLINLCLEVQEIFENESNVLELNGDFIIVGDIHGSLHDLLRILKFAHEIKLKVLFLGDYVDRGNFSLECITILFALKLLSPDSIYLIRGNHEFDSVCSLYGFKDEILNYYNLQKCKNCSNNLEKQFEDEKPNPQFDEYYINHKNANCYKYTESLYNAFVEAFAYLPICAIVNKTTFCIHGGLSPKLDLIDQVNQRIKRPIRSFEECKLLAHLLWSDPSLHSNSLFDENPRGYGYLFNKEAVCSFLKKNSLKRIIRAHQCVHKGCLKNFGDKCITVFSVSSYGKFLGNSSGVLEIYQSNDIIKPTIFTPIRHLQKKDAFYYKVQAIDQKDEKIKSYFSLAHPCLVSNLHASRIISSVNLRHYNSNIKKNAIPHHNSNIISSPLMKLRFVTNSRKSYPCGHNNILIDPLPKLDNKENSAMINENNNAFNSSP